jgi:hypothetical protein
VKKIEYIEYQFRMPDDSLLVINSEYGANWILSMITLLTELDNRGGLGQTYHDRIKSTLGHERNRNDR